MITINIKMSATRDELSFLDDPSIVTKNEITQVFQSGLDIFQFIQNNLSKTDYQKCVMALTNQLESIIDTKAENERTEFFKKIKDLKNYNLGTEPWTIQLQTFEAKEFIYDFLSNYSPDMSTYVDDRNKKFEKDTDKIYPILDNKISEIFVKDFDIHGSKYLDIFKGKFSEIYVNLDSLDKHIKILYKCFRDLDSDNSVFINYYVLKGTTFLMFNVLSEYDKLTSEPVEIKEKSSNHILATYTLEDFRKICLEGAKIFKSLNTMIDTTFSMTLCFEYNDDPSFIKFYGKLYRLDISKKLKTRIKKLK